MLLQMLQPYQQLVEYADQNEPGSHIADYLRF
jgi:hypothetical protein